MSPKVLEAKLSLLQEVLNDLKPNVESPRSEQDQAHYEIERQTQVCVDCSIAIGRRILLLEKHPVPDIGREVFLELGKHGLLQDPLAKRLAESVGLRNLLVNAYGKIDYDLFFNGLKMGFEALVDFAEITEKYTDQ